MRHRDPSPTTLDWNDFPETGGVWSKTGIWKRGPGWLISLRIWWRGLSAPKKRHKVISDVPSNPVKRKCEGLAAVRLPATLHTGGTIAQQSNE